MQPMKEEFNRRTQAKNMPTNPALKFHKLLKFLGMPYVFFVLYSFLNGFESELYLFLGYLVGHYVLTMILLQDTTDKEPSKGRLFAWYIVGFAFFSWLLPYWFAAVLALVIVFGAYRLKMGTGWLLTWMLLFYAYNWVNAFFWTERDNFGLLLRVNYAYEPRIMEENFLMHALFMIGLFLVAYLKVIIGRLTNSDEQQKEQEANERTNMEENEHVQQEKETRNEHAEEHQPEVKEEVKEEKREEKEVHQESNPDVQPMEKEKEKEEGNQKSFFQGLWEGWKTKVKRKMNF